MAKNEQAACERLPPPPPVILSEPQYYPSLESSPHSYRNLSLNEKAKFPFVPTIPFSNLGKSQFFAYLLMTVTVAQAPDGSRSPHCNLKVQSKVTRQCEARAPFETTTAQDHAPSFTETSGRRLPRATRTRTPTMLIKRPSWPTTCPAAPCAPSAPTVAAEVDPKLKV